MTPGGYAQTKAKLEDLERRLAGLASRTDLKPLHRAEVRRSYESMIRQYRREMKLFEAERMSGVGEEMRHGNQFLHGLGGSASTGYQGSCWAFSYFATSGAGHRYCSLSEILLRRAWKPGTRL